MSATSSIRFTLIAASLTAVGLLSGCSHDKRPPATAIAPPPQTDTTTLTSAQMAARPANAGSTDVSGGVSVSNEIMQTCKIALADTSNAPKFPFDQTDLLDEDFKVLNQIGECLSTGPLAGRQVLLTGHADNRGTEEYNMTLGAKRAHSVSEYLSTKGVDQGRMLESSRGELDASGTDVIGQKQDRRVDITLK